MVLSNGVLAENKELVITNANDTVEIRFDKNGTDTVSSPYVWFFNMGYPAKGLAIRSDQDGAVITEINNVVLKSPITITKNGSFTRNIPAYVHLAFSQIKIKVQTASTLLQVYGDC